jgi:hypothetical protein
LKRFTQCYLIRCLQMTSILTIERQSAYVNEKENEKTPIPFFF